MRVSGGSLLGKQRYVRKPAPFNPAGSIRRAAIVFFRLLLYGITTAATTCGWFAALADLNGAGLAGDEKRSKKYGNNFKTVLSYHVLYGCFLLMICTTM